MSESIELKDCPFCGSFGEVADCQYFEGGFYVCCSNCECRVGNCENTFDTKIEAIEAWNKRV